MNNKEQETPSVTIEWLNLYPFILKHFLFVLKYAFQTSSCFSVTFPRILKRLIKVTVSMRTFLGTNEFLDGRTFFNFVCSFLVNSILCIIRNIGARYDIGYTIISY